MRILFVCHGNVCRSTMAQFVMDHLAAERGLADRVGCDSAATSREEEGHDVHPGTRCKLAQEHVPCGHHSSRQMGPEDYGRFDLIVGMDAENLSGIYRLLAGERGFGWSWPPAGPELAAKADPKGKVHLLLDWSGRPRDIADPWYTGNFDQTYDDVVEGCSSLLDALADQLGWVPVER